MSQNTVVTKENGMTTVTIKKPVISITNFTRTINVTKVDYKTRENYEEDVRNYNGTHSSLLAKGMDITNLDETREQFIVTYETQSINQLIKKGAF